ncbi:unnamed protein product [Gordionus sp. m RMFG-2023]|uniref:endothelin-converting enzyme homolog n=1 Tax=Gordionus sp. m RMFG-2023 TaxID=3053472 RepID=UPI0030E41962
MSEITSLMDQSIDPCTDFHKFACGGYIKSTSIPVGYNQWNQFTQNYETILLIIKNLLENPNTKYEGEAERQAKIYYDSCIDKANTREELQGNPLINLLELYGGWDVINADNKPSPFIDESSGFKQIRFPDSGFANESDTELFSLDLNIDPKNSSRYLLTISVGKLTLPNRDIYDVNATPRNLKLYNAYLKYMTNIGNLLLSNSQHVSKKFDSQEKEKKLSYIDINKTHDLLNEEDRQKQMGDQLKNVMSNVLEFERIIANITPPLKTLYTFDESRYVVMSLKELDEKFDFMNWTRYANQIFGPHNLSLSPDHPFWVRSLPYMEKLTILVKRYLNDPKLSKVLNDYIMWHRTKPLTNYLSQNYRDAFGPVQRANNKEDYEELPVWKKCLKEWPKFMQFPLSSLYLRSNFNSKDKAKVEGMVDLIKVAYKERLKNLDWMDELTKIKSMEKVDSLKSKIGYPEYVVDPVELDQDYQGLDMRGDTFFKNFFRQKRVNEVNVINRVFRPVDKKRWFLPPHSVNAYYYPSKNEIVFLAGILRKPYYDKAYPDPYLFGAIGSIISHEITHGFDDNGRKFDKDGNWNLWWTNKSIVSFVDKTNCYKDQYSDYSINGHKLNGKLALGDNIADNGGVAISLQALKNYQAKNKIATFTSISNITDDQLFYLAFAQAFCSKETPEAQYLQIKTDFHSPNKYRIIGVVSNLKQFSEAYNCSAKSIMNPIKKCTLW